MRKSIVILVAYLEASSDYANALTFSKPKRTLSITDELPNHYGVRPIHVLVYD